MISLFSFQMLVLLFTNIVFGMVDQRAHVPSATVVGGEVFAMNVYDLKMGAQECEGLP